MKPMDPNGRRTRQHEFQKPNLLGELCHDNPDGFFPTKRPKRGIGQKVTHQIFLKKTSNSVYCKHTSGNRKKSANLWAKSGWELHQPPTGNCPHGRLSSAWRFLSASCAFFFRSNSACFSCENLTSQGRGMDPDFSWRSWTHCHLLWPLTGSLTADICKIHIHECIYMLIIFHRHIPPQKRTLTMGLL